MNYDLPEGEITLQVETSRIVPLDGLEGWQVDQLNSEMVDIKDTGCVGKNLEVIDKIVDNWVAGLSEREWQKIERQGSLQGIPIPKSWVKVWSFILKEPRLRDPWRSTRNGSLVGSYQHLWNLWSSDNIYSSLDEMEKQLLDMVDMGYLYAEIGEVLLETYGDRFWKKIKENTTTTPNQIVNNYLHLRMPNKIARQELLKIAQRRLKGRKKAGVES